MLLPANKLVPSSGLRDQQEGRRHSRATPSWERLERDRGRVPSAGQKLTSVSLRGKRFLECPHRTRVDVARSE